MKLFYFIKEGIYNFFINKTITFLSILVITVFLYIIGIILFSITNLNNIITHLKTNSTVIIYLNDDTKQKELFELEEFIKASFDINSIKYNSKKDSLKQFKHMSVEYKDLIDGLTYNPLPAYIELKLKNNSFFELNKLKLKLDNFNFINSMETGEKTIDSLVKTKRMLFIIFIFIGIIIFILSSFIISNIIKLTIYTRKNEIEIQKLIGGSNFIIRLPFIIEGCITACFSYLFAVVLLYITYHYINDLFYKILTIKINFIFIESEYLIFIFVFSFLLSFFGSYFSVNDFLVCNEEDN